MLGIGVIISELSGNEETVSAYKQSLGKAITKVWLGEDNALHLRFTDSAGIRVLDNGQSCCEERYMRTDDDLSHFVGARFTGAELKPATFAPSENEWDEPHEIQFLEIHTDRGSFTMANHNVHNGYYGGFAIEIQTESDEPEKKP
jgi:hypothetical protein